MELAGVDRDLKPKGKVEVPDSMFGRGWNGPLVHRLVASQESRGRQVTRKQKNRAEVKHTTKRLYRQKGTGRARAGISSAPGRRGGGRAFPATPRDNPAKELNRKEFRAGMATLLSQLAREGRLFVADEIAADGIKTKDCAAKLSEFAAEDRVLFVDTEFERNFSLSVRNIRMARTAGLSRLLSTDLMRSDRVVFSKRAVDELARAWS